MIDHVAFIVNDPEKQAEMLKQFGYQITRQTVHHGMSIELQSDKQPGLVIELCRVREGEKIGFNHLCFRVEDEAAINTLVENGVSIDKAPHLSKDSGRFITNHMDEDGIKWQITF